MIEAVVLLVLKNMKNICLAILLAMLIALVNLASQLFFTREKIQSISLLKQFLKSIGIVDRL